MQLLCLDHQTYHHGYIHNVQADYAYLVRLPCKPLAGVYRTEESGSAHPHHNGPCVPEAGKHHAHDGGLYRKVVLLVHVAEEFGLGTHASCGDGVQAAAGRHDKTVHRAEAGDGDEHINYRADGAAEHLVEGDLRQLLAEGPRCDYRIYVADRTHRPNVQRIQDYRDQSTENERTGQVLFGVFQLCVYGGRKYPALVCEGKADYRLEEALAADGSVFGGIYIVKHLKCRSVFETGYRADDAHKYERNELYNGHADLKLACDLGA